MRRKILMLVLCSLMMVLGKYDHAYASGILTEALELEDDPQAEREKGQILDGFYDGNAVGVDENGENTGSSLYSTNTYGYTHNSKFDGYEVRNGIDVSYYQGNIDWNAVRASGVEFAIIRVGYRGYGPSGNLKEDNRYAANIQGALRAGLKVGVYIYSQAITPSEAVEEANFVLSRIGGYNITFPVVIDYEYASVNGSEGGRLYDAKLSRREATEVCKAFSARVASAGYRPMIYANKSMLRNQLYASELSAKYDIWLANYTYETDYEGDYTCWQYTSSGVVNGIAGRVDRNFWYDKSSTVYQGIDYSDVYNYDYFISKYSDVAKYYSGDRHGALKYFVEFGMDAGMQGNAEFNVSAYKNRYVDLRNAFGKDLKQYYWHYIYSGKAERRDATGNPALTGRVTAYQGVDYSAVFDFDYYMAANSDLQTAYRNDDVGALSHFVEHGMAEGRQASNEFNVYTYRNRYADLRRGYKNNLKGYYLHYVQAGKAEGRSGAGTSELVPETVYEGVDYAAVYDYSYYIGKHPDLKAGYGDDTASALQHFVEHGMAEGRQASPEFNVNAYMSRYEDLKAGYGSDLKGYYIHYLSAGRIEGRDGSDLKESDYAAIYNYETYIRMNPDLKSAYGNDRGALLLHFVAHGMAEGRQASDEFNVYAYMNRYDDLRAGYGSNLKGYYLHYLQAGKAEGRNGALTESIMMLDEEKDSEAEEPETETEEATEAEKPETETEEIAGSESEPEEPETEIEEVTEAEEPETETEEVTEAEEPETETEEAAESEPEETEAVVLY